MWKILSLAAVCLAQGPPPYESSLSPPTLAARLDLSCLLRTWRIKGVLTCPGHHGLRVCLWVENAYPCGLLEVVRRPFKSHLAEMPRLGGRVTTSGHNEGGLQFAETRVFTFIPPLAQDLEIPIAAPRGPFFAVNYVSELDAAGWRTGGLDLLFAPAGGCAQRWGGCVPRSGFVLQPSEVLAAHLQAIRGGRVASSPQGRVVTGKYPFEPRDGHFIQMVSPVLRGCDAIGAADLRALDERGLSPHGAYLFIHWGLFEECRRCLYPRLLPSRGP